MENQNEESASTQPNQRLGSLSHEPTPTSSYQQAQKRDRQDSQPHESHVPPQSPKRSKNANPSPPSFPPIFPLELIVEILSNLPVKSLLRFRCVCRSWNSLITDPFFVKKHLQKAQNDPKFTKKRVLINTGNTQTQTQIQISIKSCSLAAIYEDLIVNSSEIEYPSKRASRFDWIVGSCNGLICIAIRQDTVFLLNPSLRICKRLPDLGFRKRRGCYTVYGFGFDASVDDYKVVRVFCCQSEGCGDGYESIVRVYSLRTNCWKRIQDFPFGVPCDEAGKYVDGRLNWAVFSRPEMGLSWTIVSLDLAEETYMEVLQPGFGVGVSERTLAILDGCLCVLCNYGRLYADVWVMREFGKRDSWTKLVTVPYMRDPGSELFSIPLFVSESGEILLHLGKSMRRALFHQL
ncbi:F-box/kelch-repeat protein At3g23880 isoform X2 [Durio zibethinus]|uniref:F-box/kelch-repeat protein At3g23880 isoform X2 n=1 Tax=Durio zibethinus TaxID=66656 RepID=A0A6P5X380_DURZI|nr:F-box/kelch-repeat protein At3g23880 isoform X2 [Durio zibethinus]